MTAPALDLRDLRDRYLRAQLAGDRREAMRLVVDDGIATGMRFTDLLVNVIQAAQDEIGRLWQQNRVTVAQEHMASAISQLALAALFERATPEPRLGKRLLLACVEGELHDLPARIVADALELGGFDVRFLGANTPHDDLVAMVVAERPDLVGLSVTMNFNVPALRTAVARLRAAVPEIPIFIGGHATRWSVNLAFELEVESAGTSLDDVLAVARGLVAGEPAGAGG